MCLAALATKLLCGADGDGYQERAEGGTSLTKALTDLTVQCTA